jgi:hypothetical protein
MLSHPVDGCNRDSVKAVHFSRLKQDRNSGHLPPRNKLDANSTPTPNETMAVNPACHDTAGELHIGPAVETGKRLSGIIVLQHR